MDLCTGLTLSGITPTDIFEIAAIDSKISLNPWNPDQFSAELNNSGFVGNKVCNESGTLIGFYVGRIMTTEMELLKIGVIQSMQRQKIGSMLLDALINFAKEQTVEKIFLEVSVKNTIACLFYIKAGFEEVCVRKKYYSNGDDGLVMVLKLT